MTSIYAPFAKALASKAPHRVSQEHADGFDARVDGQDKESNPHPKGTREHDEWNEGWEEGQGWQKMKRDREGNEGD